MTQQESCHICKTLIASSIYIDNPRVSMQMIFLKKSAKFTPVFKCIYITKRMGQCDKTRIKNSNLRAGCLHFLGKGMHPTNLLPVTGKY